MDEHDDRLLKELYNQGRPRLEGEAPEFEAMIQRAEAKNAERRPYGYWVAAAAVVVLVILAGVLFSAESNQSGEPFDDPLAVSDPVDSLAPVDSISSNEVAALEESEEWEDLLEFADEVWDEDYPTDFLL